jgi:hypothetical protein
LLILFKSLGPVSRDIYRCIQGPLRVKIARSYRQDRQVLTSGARFTTALY